MSKIETRPLKPELWQAFDTVVRPNGACGGCWCMFWHRHTLEQHDRAAA